MGLYCGWIMKILINIGIIESIPLLFSDLVENISFSSVGALDRSSIILFLEDKSLVYVCSEKL